MIRRRIPALLAVLCVGALAPLAAPPNGAAENLRGKTSAPRQDLRSPDSRNAARAAEIALAQERYYSSYGDPEPLAPPQSPVASDDTPRLPVALSVAATLAIVAAGAAHLRRLRIRRRRAARAAT
jgi:hypothetical protein